MLVVIVISAATLLAAFLATYEKQVLAEEANQHLVSLEKIRVDRISLETLNLSLSQFLAVTLVSGDVNYMNITGYVVNGQQMLSWWFVPNATTDHRAPAGPCNSASYLPPTPNFNCTEIAPYSSAVALLPVGSLAGPIHLVVETALANDFSFLFFPPVAIVETTILPEGNLSEPLFDGAYSYEPIGGDNASIAGYEWEISACNDTNCSQLNGSAVAQHYSGPQIEPSTLSSAHIPTDFLVTLVVTNTDGLQGNASVIYQD